MNSPILAIIESIFQILKILIYTAIILGFIIAAQTYKNN